MNEAIKHYANLIEKYCKEKRYFTARGFIFFNNISRKDMGKVAHAIKLLHKKGKIRRRGSKVWEWNGKR